VKRIVFHEITEEAIKQAVKDASDVDQNLVSRAGEPPHPRSPVRLHDFSRALEESADRAERRPRAERRRAVDCRPRTRASEVPRGERTGTSKRSSRVTAANSPPRSGALATIASRPVRISTRRASSPPNAACSRETDTRRSSDALWKNIRGRSRRRREAGRERPAPPFTTVDAHAGGEPQAPASRPSAQQRGKQRLFQEGHISYHRTDSTTLSEKA